MKKYEDMTGEEQYAYDQKHWMMSIDITEDGRVSISQECEDDDCIYHTKPSLGSNLKPTTK